uniref:DNA 3'-5' helicase n=1 Tax=Plectus sambesii TaxID=2011161 RepID=A0A914X0C0_9BILA
MSGNSRLSAELMEIDTEVAKIDELVTTLKLKRRKLLEKKQQIEKTLELRSTAAAENAECFEGETFAWSAKARRALTDIFRIANFRPLQLSAINAVLSGEDTLLVMSTGGGKSLCYQLPAVISQGVALVVSPLISLIEDQLMNLRKWGVDAGALNQATTKEEDTRIQKALIDPKSTLRLLYVTPEKLAKSKRFMAKLEKCHELKLLRLIAIDEVHCCSQWGHDFRTDYKFLNVLKRQFRGVPLLGLTATATASVLDDVKTILGISGALVFRAGFNRENLFYEVRAKPSSAEQHLDDITGLILERFRDQSGIIYCFSRKESEEVATALRKRNIRAAHYHAQMESGERTKVHQRWTEGKYHIIVATVAFGKRRIGTSLIKLLQLQNWIIAELQTW